MLKYSFNNKPKWVFLALLIVIVSLITYFKIQIQMDIGAIMDTFDYLANAAEFAGKSINYTDLNRPPFISFLTAIFFFFGDLSVTPLFIVDGLLYIAGCVGLYLFFNERFSPLVSLVGTLLFATFPMVLTLVGAGFNDVSSVGVAIWAIYLTYLAVEKNSKWFYLSFPVAMLAFLTRYNMALIIFPIFLYIFINWDKIKSRRDILIGMGLSLLIVLPFLIYLGIKFGNPLYSFMDFFRTSSSAAGSTEHFAYHPDPLYYLKNMHAYLGVQALMVLLLALLGFAVYWFRKWREIRSGKSSLNIKLNKLNMAKLVLFGVLIILFMVTFGKIHYFGSELIFFGLIYLTYTILKDLGIKNCQMDLLFFSWFMAFFIFQSVYVTKDHRYFVTMIVPIAYFLTRAFSWGASQLRVNFKGKNLTLYLIVVILSILMLFSTINHFEAIKTANMNNKYVNQDIYEVSHWLMDYDPQYKSKVIYADLWYGFGWYLQMNVGKMPIFKNNQSMYVGPEDFNFTMEDNAAFDQELERVQPDYYISYWGTWGNMTFTSYEPVHQYRTFTVFKRKGG